MVLKAQVEPSLHVVREVISPLGLQGFRAIFIACVGGGWPWESRTRQTSLHGSFLAASLDFLAQGASELVVFSL